MRVTDAGDTSPTVPFWIGEAPSRTAELSEEVGALRAALDPLLAAGDGAGARALVSRRAGVSAEVADQVVAYLAAGRAALGILPSCEDIVIERCFDETEGTQLIVHAPFGGRVNRALGLALRKRFCVSFDFELQAAADDDTVVLSLGPQHSFPLTQVPRMLRSTTATEVLTQAVLHPPHAGRPLALELQPGPLGAPLAGRPAAPDPPPAHGRRRPSGRGVAPAGRLPGERRPRSDPGPRPRAGAPDGRRLPDRGPRRAGPGRPAGRRRGGPGPGARRRVARGVAPRPRDPDRPALHLLGRGPARGAPLAGGPVASGPRADRTRRPAGAGRRAGPARRPGGGRGARPGAPPAPRPRRAARPPPVARRLPAGRRLGRVVRRSGGRRPGGRGRRRLGADRAAGRGPDPGRRRRGVGRLRRAGTSRWPGRCRWRPWWPPTRCPLAPRPAPR